MTVKTGISGLRGTVGSDPESLTAVMLVQWAQAYVATLQTVTEQRPFIALGHDARRSSPAIAALVRGALLMAGADVLGLGETLTPTVQFTVHRDDRLDGGIMVTASHNPVVWNGLKFLDEQGFFIPPARWEQMRERIAGDALPAVPLNMVGRVEEQGEVAWQAHLQAALDALPVHSIRKRRYRVALDACNGPAVRWVALLEALGCEPFLLHSEPGGFFAREAEPLPVHLSALRRLVQESRCDLGLAADPDGDRLVLVTGQGVPVSEEHTVVLAAMARAQRPGDTVVVNVVTTHALEEMLPDVTVRRTAVGEMNVVQGTLDSNAVLGGEGSGGIIVPEINLARDGLAAAGLILSLMAQQEVSLSELVARIPHWETVKSKVTAQVGSTDGVRHLFGRWQQHAPELQLDERSLRIESEAGRLRLDTGESGALALASAGPEGEQLEATGDGVGIDRLLATLLSQKETLSLDLTDGVKVSGTGAWLSLRPSNTEPIIRIMGEIRK